MADGRCLMLLIDRRVMQRNSRARARAGRYDYIVKMRENGESDEVSRVRVCMVISM